MAMPGRYLLLFLLSWILTVRAGFTAESFELAGKITLKDRHISPDNLPLVLLEGAKVPFVAHTRTDLSGKFKFKNLQPDMFTLIVYVPRAGEYRKTVEVSAGLADSKGRVFIDVEFQSNLGSGALQKASLNMLSIPEKALREYEKARRKLGSRDSEGATAHLKKAVEIAPQFVEAWNTLGTLAFKAAEYRLADSYFREALKQDPEYYPSVVNLGGALLMQSKLREALAFNIAAIQARPEDALAHSQLGLNHYYLSQFPEAEKHLKIAISLDPSHFSFPQLPLAEIYLSRKDFASAARELDQFLKLHPDAGKTAAVKKRMDRIRSALHSDSLP